MSTDEEGEYFIVEKILDSRVVNGEKEYYIKWHSLAESQNSWEKARDCFCKSLIEEYEKEKEEKKEKEKEKEKDKDKETPRKKQKTDDSEKSSTTSKSKKDDSETSGVNSHGTSNEKKASLSPDKIKLTTNDSNATEDNWEDMVTEVVTVFRFKDTLMMKLKWKSDNSILTVPAETANKKCPLKVIEFYEKHLKFVG